MDSFSMIYCTLIGLEVSALTGDLTGDKLSILLSEDDNVFPLSDDPSENSFIRIADLIF